MTEVNLPPSRLTALRYRDYRLVWLGELVSITGSQMQLAAINWHVAALLQGQTVTLALLGRAVKLDSATLGLGLVGLARVIPIVLFALAGGLLADRYDRRRLMIATRTAAAIFAAVLALMTMLGYDSVYLIYGLTALGAATTAFDTPARQSLVPNLVERVHLANALSLYAVIQQIAQIVGPALAGAMIAGLNIGLVYAVNALSFFVAIVALASIRYRGNPNAQGEIGWGALVEGLRFTYGTRIIWSTMLLDFFATFFGNSRTMLPIVAKQLLHVDAFGYGVLYSAQAVGSLIAGAALSLRKEIYQQGKTLLVSIAVFGLATALFGVSTNFVLSCLLSGLIGAGDTVSTVIRVTIRQVATPDYLRGRMTSVNMIFFMGGPQLGELEAGIVGSALGVPFAIISGGVATILLTGWIAWQYPSLRNYTSDTPSSTTA